MTGVLALAALGITWTVLLSWPRRDRLDPAVLADLRTRVGGGHLTWTGGRR